MSEPNAIGGGPMNQQTQVSKNAVLLSNLTNFGLDPMDWSLIEIDTDCFLIESKQEDELALLGKTKDSDGSTD